LGNQAREDEGGEKRVSGEKADTTVVVEEAEDGIKGVFLRWKRQGTKAIRSSHDGYSGVISRSQRAQPKAGHDDDTTRLAETRKR
jgi:hypothetical protein